MCNATSAQPATDGNDRDEFLAIVKAQRTRSAELARIYGRRGRQLFAIAFWSAVGLFTDVERFVPIAWAGFALFLVSTFCGAFAIWCWERWRFEKAVAGI